MIVDSPLGGPKRRCLYCLLTAKVLLASDSVELVDTVEHTLAQIINSFSSCAI